MKNTDSHPARPATTDTNSTCKTCGQATVKSFSPRRQRFVVEHIITAR